MNTDFGVSAVVSIDGSEVLCIVCVVVDVNFLQTLQHKSPSVVDPLIASPHVKSTSLNVIDF